MLESLAHLADDEVTRRITPAIHDPRVTSVLGAMGTDAAVLELMTMAARRERRDGHWRTDIEGALEAVAKRRGLDLAELEESVTPDRSTTTLDLGPRALVACVDTALEVRVKSGDALLRALPPKRKTDDESKYARAKIAFAELKEDVGAIARRRARWLELAMSSGETISRERFLRAWVRHPLLVHLARGLVWTSGGRAFRVAEDASFAGEDDAPIELGDVVGVAHVLEIDAARWRDRFGDYEIVQPFDQLARPVFTLSGEEGARAQSFERPLPSPIEWQRVEVCLARGGLVASGWDRGARTAKRELRRTPDAAGHVSLRADAKGLWTGAVFSFTRGRALVAPGEVHPIDVSEVMRAMLAPLE